MRGCVVNKIKGNVKRIGDTFSYPMMLSWDHLCLQKVRCWTKGLQSMQQQKSICWFVDFQKKKPTSLTPLSPPVLDLQQPFYSLLLPITPLRCRLSREIIGSRPPSTAKHKEVAANMLTNTSVTRKLQPRSLRWEAARRPSTKATVMSHEVKWYCCQMSHVVRRLWMSRCHQMLKIDSSCQMPRRWGTCTQAATIKRLQGDNSINVHLNAGLDTHICICWLLEGTACPTPSTKSTMK